MKSCLIAAGFHLGSQLQNAARRCRPQRHFADDAVCLPIFFKRGVDSVTEQLHDHRLRRAGQDQTCARLARSDRSPHSVSQRSSNWIPPTRSHQCGHDRTELASLRGHRDLARQRMGEGGNLTRRATQPMVRHRAGERVAILDRRRDGSSCPSPRSPGAARRTRATAAMSPSPQSEKIAVERKNHVGAIELRDEPDVLAEADLGRETLRLAQERIVNDTSASSDKASRSCARKRSRVGE